MRLTSYTTNFDKASQTVEEWRVRSPAFAGALKECEAMKECAFLTLGSFLLEPVSARPRPAIWWPEHIDDWDSDGWFPERSGGRNTLVVRALCVCFCGWMKTPSRSFGVC